MTSGLSVGLPSSPEQLGDQICTALGDREDILEAVTIESETSYTDLPQSARERLGINEVQKNVLVRLDLRRLDLRPLDRTLTDAEANGLRNDVYDAIHKGSTGQWAGR